MATAIRILSVILAGVVAFLTTPALNDMSSDWIIRFAAVNYSAIPMKVVWFAWFGTLAVVCFSIASGLIAGTLTLLSVTVVSRIFR